jgi:cytochrome c oxidase assembly protein subunit 15
MGYELAPIKRGQALDNRLDETGIIVEIPGQSLACQIIDVAALARRELGKPSLLFGSQVDLHAVKASSASRRVNGWGMKTATGATAVGPTPASAAEIERGFVPRLATERNVLPIAVWLLACCGMIFVMVVIGGVTRLTLSGLSITEWQPVIGIVPPLSPQSWAEEFEKYRHIPQYRLINSGMSLDAFKTIYLWEYFHRLWGRLIGFAYALPLAYFLVTGRLPRRLLLPLAGILALGFAQGALGWYMVESGLADRVEVSQYRLVAHLALALAIYAATLWIALDLLSGPGQTAVPPHWRRASEALIALVALTILAGGFVAGLNAGLTYNSFPLMDGSFIPAGYAQLQPFARNWFENVAAVQFDHRLLAMTTVAAVGGLWLAGWRAALPRPGRLALHALVAAAMLQFALGLATLLLVVPIPLAAAHQAGAVLLLTAAIVMRHTVRRAAVAPVRVSRM